MNAYMQLVLQQRLKHYADCIAPVVLACWRRAVALCSDLELSGICPWRPAFDLEIAYLISRGG